MLRRSGVISLIVILLIVALGEFVLVNALDKQVVNNVIKYGLNEVIDLYKTEFNLNNHNRATNINIAAAKINGQIVMPDEIFSFNNIVGPRTIGDGYKKSLEIVGGEFVNGVGGGVCQVSSTLYNAVLLANLEIVERKNHSRPVSYVPLGRGATVYYKLIDFKFKNNTNSPVIISSKVNGNELMVSILGKDNGLSVDISHVNKRRLSPKIISEIDRSLPLGAEEIIQVGQEGYEVFVTRTVKKGDQLLKTEIISKDIYVPKNKIVKINPKN